MNSFPKALNGCLFLAACVAAKASLPPIPADLTTPVQQRIAIHGPNSVSIGWNTYQELPQESACVDYGTSSDALTERVCSSSPAHTYGTSRTYFNTVTLTDLAPASTYYYRVASTNASANAQAAEHFLSPRAPGDRTAFALSAVPDLGVYGADGYTIDMDLSRRDTIPDVEPSLNHTTIGRLATDAGGYELVVHPGDLGYADDWYLRPKNLLHGEDAFQAILEQFYGQQLEPIAARKPYMTSPGNHEAACQEIPYTTGLCPEGQRNFTDFLSRFEGMMPDAFASTSADETARVNANKAKMLANPPFWYSFEYGMLHFVMINTETDFPSAPDGPDGSEGLDGGPFGAPNQQLEFLEADLASVDRTVTPWLVVAGHRPWYSTSGGSACAPCQAAFEPLLNKYAVDLAVFGHVHNSQRFQPVANGTVDPRGLDDPAAPMYIVTGGAGNIEGLSSVGTRQDFNAFAYADDFSYAKVSFLDANYLQVDFIRSSTGEILDTSTLYKSHAVPFPRQ